jgi:hypothetical protein
MTIVKQQSWVFDIYFKNRNDQRKYYIKDGGGGGHERLLKNTENERLDKLHNTETK